MKQVSGRGTHRVALLTSSYAPHVGGVETHVAAVSRELGRAGHAVEVWSVDRGEHLGVRQVDGITVRYLPTPLPARTGPALLRFGVAAPPAAVHWWRALRALRPDVLHVHCFGPNGVYALALHRVSRVPLVVTSHGETVADDHGVFDHSALLRAALRRAVRRAGAVTAPSEMVLRDLRSRFGLVGGEVVPNGVDLDVAASGDPPFAPTGGDEGVRTVLAVGRLGRMKGFDLLLDALAEPALDGVRLVVGGDGPELDALTARADRLGVSDRVSLIGRLTPEEVAAAMSAADVVVVPSRREAFGIVALEAWRAGTPLVGTVHGGMGDVVRDGLDALLVDPFDPFALAEAVARVLGDRALAAAMVAEGSRRVADFAWSGVLARYVAVYDVVSS